MQPHEGPRPDPEPERQRRLTLILIGVIGALLAALIVVLRRRYG
jgi:LPS O-antigen subunit length determinant protein (WzzB/FepE family)